MGSEDRYTSGPFSWVQNNNKSISLVWTIVKYDIRKKSLITKEIYIFKNVFEWKC